jgi:dephospho-CoA kinase
MAKTMVVIGVTGGIASGKSRVTSELGRLGACVISADTIGHAVLQDPAVRAALVERWGSRVLSADGEICRSAVAERVFAPPPDGPRELAFLEHWTHPRMGARIADQLRAAAQGDRGVWAAVALDAAVLYKAGWDAMCDVIIFVDAAPAARAARARQRGWSDGQWRAREAAQPALAQQRARADVVIDNSGTLAQLIAQVEKFWQSLRTCGVPAAKIRERPFSKSPEEP